MRTCARPRHHDGGGRPFRGRVKVFAAATALAASILPTFAAGAADPSPTAFSSQPNPTWGTGPSDDPASSTSDRAGKVVAIAEAGDRVFFAGEFTGVMPPGASTNKARQDPTPIVHRPYLAAIDRNTGALLDWDAHPDAPVLSLALSADGRRLYAGGMFKSIGGAATPRLAALDIDTGVADPGKAARLAARYADAPGVRTARAEVTSATVEALFAGHGVPEEFDLLSIDIDGNDYWVWNAIQRYRPRVVVIEYNASYPPPRKWVMAENPAHAWDGTNYFGASLASLAELGRRKGYTLVGTESRGVNAFFVRDDQLRPGLFPDAPADELYSPPAYGPGGGGHPPGSGPFAEV